MSVDVAIIVNMSNTEVTLLTIDFISNLHDIVQYFAYYGYSYIM